MTTTVTGAQFGAYTNLGKAHVDKWASKENANDCYWNIAKNQLGENATNAEILEVTNELIKLNAKKTSSGEYNTIVYENQEVLLDLKSTINQSDKEIEAANEIFNSAYNNYSNLIQKLNSANSQYLNSYNAYQNALSSGASVNSYYEEYIQALNSMLEIKKEVETAQVELENAQKNSEELQTALIELQEEYNQKEEVNSKLKEEFDNKIKNFKDDFSTKQKEVETLNTAAQKEIDDAQNNKDTAVSSNIVNSDENGIVTAKSPDESANDTKQTQIENLKAQYSEVQDEQGCIGKLWNGIKNVFNTKYSSNNVEKVFEKVESGEMTYEEAQNMISEYSSRQESGKDLLINTVTGVIAYGAIQVAILAAPVTFGLSLVIGAGVAGLAKMGLNTLDRATNNVKNDEIDAKEMTKDLITGGVDGAVTALTFGAGSSVVQISKETGKVLVKETIKQGAIAGAKEGALDGGAAAAAEYIADVATGEKEYSTQDLLKTTAQGAAMGGSVGAVMGGTISGVQAAAASKSIAKEAQESAQNALEDTIQDATQKQAANTVEDTAQDTVQKQATDAADGEFFISTQKQTAKTVEDGAQNTAQKQAANTIQGNMQDAVYLQEYIDYTPAKTIEEAKEFARKYLGIEDYNITDLESANHINKSLANYYNSSSDHKRIIAHIDKLNGNGFAGIIPDGKPDHTLSINQDSVAGLDELINKIFSEHGNLTTECDIADFGEEQAELLQKWYSNSSLNSNEKAQLATFLRKYNTLKNDTTPTARFANLIADDDTVSILASKNLPTTLEGFSKLSTEEQEEICTDLIENYGKKITIQNGGTSRPINHELGHLAQEDSIGNEEFLKQCWTNGNSTAAQKQAAKQKFKEEIGEDLFEAIKLNVTPYATSSPAEFVAETYSYLCNGVKFCDEIMELYKKYGGIIPSNIQ